MKTKLRFRDLALGAVFRFASERDMPNSGMARGPWRKITVREYVHIENGLLCEVGTIAVEVIRESSAELRKGTLAIVGEGGEAPNLDCDWPDHLKDFAADVDAKPFQMADLLFPDKPLGYGAATLRLGVYAIYKARAMESRTAGNIREALRLEAVCDRQYQRLPMFARW